MNDLSPIGGHYEAIETPTKTLLVIAFYIAFALLLLSAAFRVIDFAQTTTEEGEPEDTRRKITVGEKEYPVANDAVAVDRYEIQLSDWMKRAKISKLDFVPFGNILTEGEKTELVFYHSWISEIPYILLPE